MLWWPKRNKKEEAILEIGPFRKIHFPFARAPQPSRALVDSIKSIFCPICGNTAKIKPFDTNVRESGICSCCGSWNRQRLTAVLLLSLVERLTGVRPAYVASQDMPGDLKIFSAEWFGALHEALKRLPGYSWSRYSGERYKSGDIVDGHPHQDLLATSFSENHFDIVLTSDVMEHIPEPYLAHKEIQRILRPGGSHLFTVPCDINSPLDDQWAVLAGNNLVLLTDPQWHGEHEDSNLVYNIFGLEMICHLWTLGFAVKLHEIYEPTMGIIGQQSVIFEATKHHDVIPRPVPTGLRNNI